MGRNLFLLTILTAAAVCRADDVITTLAGAGTQLDVDGVSARSSGLGFPTGIAVDSVGNVYIADDGRIRKVDPGGIITTVAGGGTRSLTNGAPATSVSISPTSVAVDSVGNLYMVDQISHVLKVDTLGNISTIAGLGPGFAGDGGPATSGRLSVAQGSGLAVDGAGNVYVADTNNHRIRKIDRAGIITTVAGIGTRSFSGDGGRASSAGINGPLGVAVDRAGNVFIADTENGRIRKIDTNGIISTVAGNGTSVFAGDGGPATRAELSLPGGVAVDGAGNLYIAASGDGRIRKVDTTGIITTVAGVGFNFVFDFVEGGPAVGPNLGTPVAVAVDRRGNFYLVVRFPHRVFKVTVANPQPPSDLDNSGLSLGDSADNPGGCHCGDPITISTGNLFEEIPDYSTAGPNRLQFTRYYNSLGSSSTLATRLGVNWRSNFDRYLRIVSNTHVIAERADGREVSFTGNGGSWTTDADIDLKLANAGGIWTLTDAGDTVEIYRARGDKAAALESIQLRNGYLQTLRYDESDQLIAVSDSFGRELDFAYDGGTLQTVTTPDTLLLRFGYSGDGKNLSSVTYSTSPETSQTYLYENPALPAALTGIIDENGNRYATWSYDASGRAIASYRGDGAGRTSVVYNDSDGSRTVTNPLGAQAVYKFTMLQGVSKVTEVDSLATATTPAAKIVFTYDANGFLASRTDWNGNLTKYGNDARGRPISITEAAGTPQERTRTFAYHAGFNLPVRIVEPGLTTTFTYDTNGNLLTKTYTDTTTTTVPYVTGGQTRTWTYTWSGLLPASVKTPRADVTGVTRLTFDSSGTLITATNALGQTTRIADHSPGGYPLTIVDANGVTTHFTYDARLRLVSSTTDTAAGPLTTTYNYDPVGNLLSVVRPDGSALTNSYDAARRLTGVSDLLNQTVAYTLDALGDTVQTDVMDADGKRQRTHPAVFDALGRRLRDTAGAGQVTGYTYDNNGNRLSITDPLNRVTQQTYDALNRLVKTVDAARGTAAIVYDAHDRPTSITDPNGATTTFVYDGFGEIIQRTSPDSGTTVSRYDADGNLTQRVDGSGATTNFTYDALDRPLTRTYPANPAENITYRYDEPGAGFGVRRLTSVTDPAGTLRRSYDERGNVVSETRSSGPVTLATAYAYDGAGRRASIGYPSGWTVAFARDAMGRITAANAISPDASSTVPIVTGASYQPFGPANTLLFGNGAAQARGFDADYRLTGITDSGSRSIQKLTYGYDSANNVVSIADGVASGNSQTLRYDDLNRLIGAAGAYGSFTYTYDTSGNRLSQTAGGTTTAYTYTARSNQLTRVATNSGAQSFGYDKGGRLNSMSSASGPATGMVYNQSGRLSKVTAGSDSVAQYTYDAFGQRLVKTGKVSGTVRYQYDTARRLLEETDENGHPLVDYIYLDGLPVAALAARTGQFYWLHTDRLGTPQVATDNGQSVVWTGNYGPFGEMSAVPAGIVQNLRLPGQEFDIDAGLNYNSFRDYVPGLGRYLETDPIGLAGGVNTYAYGGQNPARWIDPLGLDQQDPPDSVIAPGTIANGIDKTGNYYSVPVEGAGNANAVMGAVSLAQGWTADQNQINQLKAPPGGFSNPVEFNAWKALGIMLHDFYDAYQMTFPPDPQIPDYSPANCAQANEQQKETITLVPPDRAALFRELGLEPEIQVVPAVGRNSNAP